MRPTILLAILWAAWCTLHSALITKRVTGYLKRSWGSAYRYYRLVYNSVSVITFVPVFAYAVSLSGQPIFRYEGGMIVVRVFLISMALLLLFLGAGKYDLLRFAGLRQVRTASTAGALAESGAMETTGILGVTRHPWYLGAIALIWANDIDVVALVTNVIFTAYLVAGAMLEERKLVDKFGEEYREYQERVSMLFPFKFLAGWIARFLRWITKGSA